MADEWSRRMKPRFESLPELLNHFDHAAQPYSERDVENALIALKKQLAELNGAVAPEIDYEILAFAFHEQSHYTRDEKGWFSAQFSGRAESGETVNYPNLECVTQEVIEYWARRASETQHPILLARYGSLAGITP
jgi:hypothetical protein